MNNLHVKTGDTAVVLSGKEKGKRGKVLSVDPKKGMVVIEGVNMVKCRLVLLTRSPRTALS